MIEATLDTTRLQAQIRALYAELPDKLFPEMINQAILDVCVKAYDETPPYTGGKGGTGMPAAKRKEIKAHLTQVLAQKFTRSKSGKSRKAGRARDQLRRVDLITQAWRHKHGLKGLYGEAMRKASSRFLKGAVSSVGYMKSVFLPIIRTLNPLVKYKFYGTRGVAHWSNSGSKAGTLPAKKGWNPAAKVIMDIRIADTQLGKMSAVQTQAMQKAIEWKTGKLRDDLIKAIAGAHDRAGVGGH